jgi:hypothetical protein
VPQHACLFLFIACAATRHVLILAALTEKSFNRGKKGDIFKEVGQNKKCQLTFFSIRSTRGPAVFEASFEGSPAISLVMF